MKYYCPNCKREYEYSGYKYCPLCFEKLNEKSSENIELDNEFNQEPEISLDIENDDEINKK